MANEVNMVKCACADCVCVLPSDSAIQRNGKLFCGDACAKGHSEGTGCGHVGCECHG